jgi:hypothetical protein
LFLKLNAWGHSPCITSSLTRGWVCFSWTGFAFVKCTYRIYGIGLHGYGERPLLEAANKQGSEDHDQEHESLCDSDM